MFQFMFQEFHLDAVPPSLEFMAVLDKLQQLNSCPTYLFFLFNVCDPSLEKCGLFLSVINCSC
ncbi:hypothetical protein C1H46_005053 [Malus baccata]|uniref:Uncharacterized protein n=1 Tax=Malus baccata TaxID=106549 RepID=A0A540NE42_MALBA|nr:hypothetical protein C1H46_005053 [Malus baccata]